MYIQQEKINLDPELVALRTKITKFEEAKKEHPDNGDIESRLDSIKQAYDDATENPAEDMAVIHVYFKELGTIQYSRDELYSLIDFIGKRDTVRWSMPSLLSFVPSCLRWFNRAVHRVQPAERRRARLLVHGQDGH